jgi:hypothetical protein
MMLAEATQSDTLIISGYNQLGERDMTAVDDPGCADPGVRFGGRSGVRLRRVVERRPVAPCAEPASWALMVAGLLRAVGGMRCRHLVLRRA